MSNVHEYFKRSYEDWNIREFLEECNVEPLEQKIDCYIKSLQEIVKYGNENGKKRAQRLLDRYKKGFKPDRQIARSWDNGRHRNNVYIHKPTISGESISGLINMNNNGTFVTGPSEKINIRRYHGEKDGQEQIKRIRSERQQTPENKICSSLFPRVE
ncbi:9570_t:CDS:2, partial [Acaulospora morrowiae]